MAPRPGDARPGRSRFVTPPGIAHSPERRDVDMRPAKIPFACRKDRGVPCRPVGVGVYDGLSFTAACRRGGLSCRSGCMLVGPVGSVMLAAPARLSGVGSPGGHGAGSMTVPAPLRCCRLQVAGFMSTA